MTRPYLSPEPVPPASQLALLPFLAAIDGHLRNRTAIDRLRLTVHRTFTRQRKDYLQQVCPYLREGDPDWKGAGRMLPVDEGLIGAAFENGRVWRTRYYSSYEGFLPDLIRSMKESGDQRKPEEVALSYLAVPFLGPDDQVVLILYADCYELNFFSTDSLVQSILGMCRGFCRLFDSLQKEPFANIRNFPLHRGEPVAGSDRTVYKIIQECLTEEEPPKFQSLTSFNYEASVA